MLNSIPGWANTLLTEEAVASASALALVDSLILAVMAVSGRRRAERLVLHMAETLATRMTDPDATEEEQAINRLAMDEFRRRVLLMFPPRPKRVTRWWWRAADRATSRQRARPALHA